MTPRGTSRPSGGRRTMAAAVAVIALLGAALLVIALAGQVGDPPTPALRSGAGSASDGGGATSPSPGAEGMPGGADASDGGSGPPSADPPASAAGPSASPADPSSSPAMAGSEAPFAEPLPASEPTGLRIDAIGVEEQVFPIGLGQDGQLLAPRGDRADLAAWFEGSPTPGETGPSVIEGHVTWGGDPSVFFELGALTPGDRIEVDREDGSVAVFEVYHAARYPKDEFPTVAVYGRTEGPELRLITCSGDLDEDGHHLDNTVVSARLVGD